MMRTESMVAAPALAVKLAALSVLAVVASGCGASPPQSSPAPPPPVAVEPPAPQVQAKPAAAAPISSRNGPLPTFSRPTDIDNEWYPVADIATTILQGTEEGAPYRVELTLLPGARSIPWQGGTTDTVRVRQRGWVDGEINEETIDYYAQGDDGGVWYFGEDVNNYEDGEIADHDGTWLAGRQGALPGRLVPGEPRRGLVFYSEELPRQGIVERDEITNLAQPVVTPDGPVTDGMLVEAVQDDGTEESKVYAKGFGSVLERSEESELRLVAVRPAT